MDTYPDIFYLPYRNTTDAGDPEERAAQFSSYDALAGFDAVLLEAARQTGVRVELDIYEQEALDARLRHYAGQSAPAPTVTIVYFQPDAKKEGGAYLTVSGTIRRLDAVNNTLYLTGGQEIPLDQIFAIDGPLEV